MIAKMKSAMDIIPGEFHAIGYNSTGLKFNLVVNAEWIHKMIKSESLFGSAGTRPVFFPQGKMIVKGENKFEIEILEVSPEASNPSLQIFVEKVNKGDVIDTHNPSDKSIVSL